jgi:hypothetical protein
LRYCILRYWLFWCWLLWCWLWGRHPPLFQRTLRTFSLLRILFARLRRHDNKRYSQTMESDQSLCCIIESVQRPMCEGSTRTSGRDGMRENRSGGFQTLLSMRLSPRDLTARAFLFLGHRSPLSSVRFARYRSELSRAQIAGNH